MKKSLFLLVFLFASLQTLFSQSWFAPENAWVYRSLNFTTEGYAEAKILRDNVIDNLSAKIMHFDYKVGSYIISETSTYAIEEIVYEKNDSVFYLNASNEFTLMYDFTMEPGDSIILYGAFKGMTCDQPTIYYLDSVSTISQGTQTFRVQHMTFFDPFFNNGGQRDIIEFIGHIDGSFILQNDHPCVTDIDALLLCSFENNVSNFQFLEDVDCYEVITSNKETELNKSIHVYPNPSNGNYFIDIEVAPTKIEVLNTKGQIVATFKETKHLDVSYLESGSYFLKIWTDKNIHVEKIMVH